jgi:DNA-binding IclR family transcriptional regulator
MMSSNTSKVRAVLAGATDPMSCRELVQQTGLAGAKVSMCLQQLEREGAIEKTTAARPHRYRPRSAEAPAEAPAAAPPRRAAKQRGRRPRADVPAAAAPVFAFFIDDDGDLQICRRDGDGEAAVIARAEALRLADFLARMRPALEPA